MSHRFVPTLLVAAATGVGCSAPVVDDVADASGSMTAAVVVVERRGAEGQAQLAPAQTTVSAKFMRLSAPVDPELAERVVGAKLDLPAIGSCRADTSSSAELLRTSTAARTARGAIELVDVGDLTLRAALARVPLAVRAFPEVGELVSGMFYTSPDTASELPSGAVYTLEATGAASVDHFSIEVEGPPALEDVRVGGAALVDGVVVEEGPIAIRWRSPAAGSSMGSPLAAPASDLVYVDLSSQGATAVRCTFEDNGAASVPAWVAAQAMREGATLSVHRVRERSFVSPGVDTGVIRFDLAVLGRIALLAP